VSLPVAVTGKRAEPAEAAAAGAQDNSHGAPGAIGGHVLLVEDDEVNAAVAQGYLEALGCTSVWTKDGAEALARSATDRFDLIFMDLNMPGFDGYETAKLMRSRSAAGPRMPIVALTAHTPSQVRERCAAAGIDDVLSKPYTLEDCEQLLRRWITRKTGTKAPARPVTGDRAALPVAASEPGADLSKLDNATVVRLRGVPAPGRGTDLYSRLVALFRAGSAAA